jgi:exosome complex component RRP40
LLVACDVRALRLSHIRFAFAFAIAMATTLSVVLPGDAIPAHALPTGTGKKKTLTLGPGLRHIPPNTVTTTVAGTLVTDNRKNAALVEFNSGRVCQL